jgi:LAO/AO transport system kinase
VALLDAACGEPRAHVIGFTGPPGVGKSTLLGALIAELRGPGRTVGVIAVDPSSRPGGGARLGGRTRIATKTHVHGAVIRSMGARDRLGGLAELSVAATVLMRAVFDVVLIETVGVGQSETDVAEAADTVVFCVQPGSGDSLQFMKAGIVEIPHLVVVTKADMGAPAERAKRDVKGALTLAEGGEAGWQVPVLLVAAGRREGLGELVLALDDHWAWLSEDDRLAARRHAQAEFWLADAIRQRFGREGLKRAGALSLAAGEAPFGRLAQVTRRLGG